MKKLCICKQFLEFINEELFLKSQLHIFQLKYFSLCWNSHLLFLS